MAADFLARAIDAEAPAAPIRKAAMLLHSMTEVDRRWMLARIDAAQRPRIEQLLGELRTLDFPTDADLVRDSLKTAPALGAMAPQPVSHLSGWSPNDAARVLLQEPDDLIALILRSGAWPWAQNLRARLGAERTRNIDGSRYSLADALPVALTQAALNAATTSFLALPKAPPKPTPPRSTR